MLEEHKDEQQSLGCIQALALDAIGPLTDLLEKLNFDEMEISVEEVGYVVELAVTLLGNALFQISGM